MSQPPAKPFDPAATDATSKNARDVGLGSSAGWIASAQQFFGDMPMDSELAFVVLDNLMAATDIGTIFLDHQLRIQRFTPGAQKIFNLIRVDVGRPLSDITPKLTYQGFLADAEQVLRELTTMEREVPVGEHRWCLVRIAPYRTAEDRIAGVVATFIDTTRWKRTKDEHCESEERFRAMITQTRSGIAQTDLSGNFTFVNDRYCEITGYPRAELLRRRMEEITDERDLPRNLELFQRLVEKGEPFVIEKRYRRKDGSPVWVENNVALIRDAAGNAQSILAVSLEVTQRKEAEDALHESEERFRLLVNDARDYAMFLLDPSNQIIYWNAGAERVFGWSADEALGQSGELIFTPEDRVRKQEEKEMLIALRKGVASDRRWHLRKDGSRVWIDGVMRRLDDENGNLRGLAKIARDATELHREEEELQNSHQNLERRVRERTAELTALNRKLQDEIKQRTEVEQELLLVSERERRRIGQDLHDSLCQELAAAALFLRTAAHKIEKKSPSGAKVLEDAARIVNDNVGLARDLARGLHPVELSSSGLANALRELAFRTSQMRSVICHFECPRQVRIRDEAVALNLFRIAQEAVANAVKNGKASTITIKLVRNRKELTLTVKDNGKGFSTSKSHRGMGLHIMKYRADVIGARLTIESAEGQGALVTCILPGE